MRQTTIWVKGVLYGIFLYYLLSGIWLVLVPSAAFDLLAIAPPNHIWLAQMAGLLTAIFGFIFYVAARDPHSFQSIIKIGLAAQLLVPAFASVWISQGVLPVSAFIPFVAADLSWALFLFLVLRSIRNRC